LIIGLSIVLGASLLSVGVSSAAGSNIKACAKKSTGVMRLIDSSKKCYKNERTLTWGAKGTTGARGAAGANGYSKTYSHEFTSADALGLSNDNIGSFENEFWLNSIPAGTYTFSVSAQVNYRADTSHAGNAFLNCMLSSEGNYTEAYGNRNSVFWPTQSSSGPGRQYQLSFQPITAHTEQIGNLSAVSTITLATATNLRFVCAMDQGKRSTEVEFDESMLIKYLSLIFTAVDTDTAVTMEVRE
jgi:hypothetical protein